MYYDIQDQLPTTNSIACSLWESKNDATTLFLSHFKTFLIHLEHDLAKVELLVSTDIPSLY